MNMVYQALMLQINWLSSLLYKLGLKCAIEYEYGTISNGMPVRRNKVTHEVEFILWRAGQQGHKQDYWHIVGDGWAYTFTKDERYDHG